MELFFVLFVRTELECGKGLLSCLSRIIHDHRTTNSMKFSRDRGGGGAGRAKALSTTFIAGIYFLGRLQMARKCKANGQTLT